MYYKHGNGGQTELHLYFGEIDNIPKNKGWIVNQEFGLVSNSTALLFHNTEDDSLCPEAVGPHWHTSQARDIGDINLKCL